MAHDLTITPNVLAAVTVPDPGDLRRAAGIELMGQQLADAIAFETVRAGTVEDLILACYQCVDLQHLDTATGSLIISLSGTSNTTHSLLSSGVSTLAGDIVEVVYSTWFGVASGTIWYLELQANQNGGGLVLIDGTHRAMVNQTVASTDSIAVTVSGMFVVASPGTLAISAKAAITSFGGTVGNDTEHAHYKLWRKL